MVQWINIELVSSVLYFCDCIISLRLQEQTVGLHSFLFLISPSYWIFIDLFSDFSLELKQIKHPSIHLTEDNHNLDKIIILGISEFCTKTNCTNLPLRFSQI